MSISSASSALRRGSILGVGLLACALLLVGCDSNGGTDTPTVTELAANESDLSTLVGALQQAGLDETLNNENQSFTVFAPVNSAFQNIDAGDLTSNSDLLDEVLTYHVVAGQRIRAGDIQDGQTVQTVEGGTLTFSVDGNAVQVNSAAVTTVNLEASNGVVHLVDGVLLETVDVVDRAVLAPQFSILADLVGRANLASALRGPGPDGEDGLTVFAPTNQAFLAALDQNGNDQIDDSEVPSNAGAILQYHVLDDVFFAGDVPTSATDVPTLEGSNVTVQRSDGTVTVNESTVAVPNVAVENGVIHGIDGVLMPPSN